MNQQIYDKHNDRKTFRLNVHMTKYIERYGQLNGINNDFSASLRLIVSEHMNQNTSSNIRRLR